MSNDTDDISRSMIIGFITHPHDVGSALVFAAKSLNLHLAVANISDYESSLNHLWGKVFYRIAQHRTLEWFDFQRKILDLIDKFEPQLVIVTGIIPLGQDIFHTIHNYRGKIVNYLTDNPWNPALTSQIFRNNLRLYDCVFSTKTAIIPQLIRAGVKKTEFLPFAFNPQLHYREIQYISVTNDSYPDICFIGAADRERYKFFEQLIPKLRGKLRLYGSGWEKSPRLRRYSSGFLYGDSYRKVIQGCKVNIGLLRRGANCDLHNMRSYEIPACGGLGIYEDTPEHRSIFKGYPDYGFFTSVGDLADKCHWLLDHPEARQEMCQLSYELIVQGSNTYYYRLKTILDIMNK
jgi:hypothetical protein